MNIRNVAVIAHVDHGKTTLIDSIFKQTGVSAKEERALDKMDLERERGITIAAKNCSTVWNDHKINILDTPGHADFGGEVERALAMVDGAILLVDSAEGTQPQTRYVLSKALEQGLKVIVCINKIDRKDQRAAEVLDEIGDLFLDLEASDEQLDFPVLYAIGRDGTVSREVDSQPGNLEALFEEIVRFVPPPRVASAEEPFSMQISNLEYSDYLGQLVVGVIRSGSIKERGKIVRIGEGNEQTPCAAQKVQIYAGMSVESTDHAEAGEIVLIAGVENATIGDTLRSEDSTECFERLRVDEPTVRMRFSTNTSPLSGKEGQFIHPNKIAERLEKEALRNVSIRLKKDEASEAYFLYARGELQLAVIIETLRREGFELSVERPDAVKKEIDGVTCEPIELVDVRCDQECSGLVTEYLTQRKGFLVNMMPDGEERLAMQFEVPSRSLLGYRSKFLSDTRGTGVMNAQLKGFEPHRGEIIHRSTGSLVSDREGSSVAYALFNLEARGEMFIGPNTKVYAGMVIGENSRSDDLFVNPMKAKKLTNMRASGKDENVQLRPPRVMGIEDFLAYLNEDELLEVTPSNLRVRKKKLPVSKGS